MKPEIRARVALPRNVYCLPARKEAPMPKFRGLALLAASALLAACEGMEFREVPRGPAPTGGDAPAPVAPAGEDRHFIGADEVFALQYEGQETLPCHEVGIARVVEGPSEATKGQAKLFSVRAGKEIWSSHWWRTRCAEAADLKPGTPVIFFKGPLSENRAHTAPSTKALARPGGDAWFRSTVSDDSDLFKGVVKVAGYGYGIQVEALRVTVP
jgi:hypothetical protein